MVHKGSPVGGGPHGSPHLNPRTRAPCPPGWCYATTGPVGVLCHYKASSARRRLSMSCRAKLNAVRVVPTCAAAARLLVSVHHTKSQCTARVEFIFFALIRGRELPHRSQSASSRHPKTSFSWNRSLKQNTNGVPCICYPRSLTVRACPQNLVCSASNA